MVFFDAAARAGQCTGELEVVNRRQHEVDLPQLPAIHTVLFTNECSAPAIPLAQVAQAEGARAGFALAGVASGRRCPDVAVSTVEDGPIGRPGRWLGDQKAWVVSLS
ncbi:hypothetical protein [Micromonospora coerulea]|uniref:hypothetical protein n=1 Tax=Micromonospora coerulea TaxID=47856 RepID=UPI0019040BF7|nr:hypothetical protein [Micromonospora veneta]